MRCFAISVSRLRTERVAHGSVFAENSRNCKSSGFTYLQLKGISCYGKALIEKGQHIDKDIVRFVENCLFTTLTNVNFDADVHVSLLRESQQIKENFVKLWAKSKSYSARNLQSSRNKVGNAQRRTACGNYVRKVA